MNCRPCTFIRNILVWLDEGLNVFIIGIIGIFYDVPCPDEGSPHYTVSQVIAELRQRGYAFGVISCKILTWLFRPFNLNVKDYDHCREALRGVKEGETAA
jgi:hypothetical protein